MCIAIRKGIFTRDDPVSLNAHEHFGASTARRAASPHQFREHLRGVALEHCLGIAAEGIEVEHLGLTAGLFMRWRMVGQRSHRPRAEVRQTIERRDGLGIDPATAEVPIHQQQAPAVR